MPSESIAGFLDEAKAKRVLIPEQVEHLIRQPDIPHQDLDALCAYLEARGALTRFQADALRSGRGADLTFAGYPVLDELGPCPGGTAYRALHPSLRTPVVLRKLRPDALPPGDTPVALVGRARSFPTYHPNLLVPLDAGEFGGAFYSAVEEPADAATLEQLVVEIGPMPAFLAAEFGRQAASALGTVDARGLWHGDVRPVNLIVGPMTVKTTPDGKTKRRPAPNAAVRVAELGLVPLGSPSPAALPYAPPERAGGAPPDGRGDQYGLGACLYYLLTGRPPFAASSPDELLVKLRTADPVALGSLRPDVPPALVAVVERLMAKRHEQRFARFADAEAALLPFCRPGTVPPPPAQPIHPTPVPVAAAVPDSVEAYSAPAEEWGTSDAGMAFNTSHAAEGPIRKERTPQQQGRTRMLIVLGLCLHTSAMLLLAGWVFGWFERTPEPEPVPVKKEKDKKKSGRA